MYGGNILIYESMRNKEWREYASRTIRRWEKEFETLKVMHPKLKQRIASTKEVLDSDREWLRTSTPQTTDQEHKERIDKKIELIKKTRREQEEEAEKKKEAEKRKWEEDEARRIAENERIFAEKEQRIAEQKRRQEEYDKFIYFYESREDPTMTKEEAIEIWFNKMSSKQRQDWEIEKKEKDRLALVALQAEQRRIDEENRIAMQKYLEERNERIERIKRKAERDSVFQANLEKIGIENMADLEQDNDLYKEKAEDVQSQESQCRLEVYYGQSNA